MTKLRRALGGAFCLLAAACGGERTRVAAVPSPPKPYPNPHALATPAELEAAPPCVRAVAALRQCHEDARLRKAENYSCPSSALHSSKLNTAGLFVPQDLNRAFDSGISCSVELGEAGAEVASQLESAGFHPASSVGMFQYGTVPLSHLYCVAALEVVRRLTCAEPGPVTQ